MEKPQRPSSAYSESKTTRIESEEQGYYKACTGVICKKLYELVLFYSSTIKFSIRSGRCEVGVGYGLLNGSEANILLWTSKLISYAIAYLIWCPYID